MTNMYWHTRHMKWSLTRVLRGLLKCVTVYPVMLACALPHGLYVACQTLINRLDGWWIR